uniref:Uncharacterized protein n=1 Tax=Noccaea caerulescens TaxID=107243 RepID=A0A1J3ESK3_NOCCA
MELLPPSPCSPMEETDLDLEKSPSSAVEGWLRERFRESEERRRRRRPGSLAAAVEEETGREVGLRIWRVFIIEERREEDDEQKKEEKVRNAYERDRERDRERK